MKRVLDSKTISRIVLDEFPSKSDKGIRAEIRKVIAQSAGDRYEVALDYLAGRIALTARGKFAMQALGQALDKENMAVLIVERQHDEIRVEDTGAGFVVIGRANMWMKLETGPDTTTIVFPSAIEAARAYAKSCFKAY